MLSYGRKDTAVLFSTTNARSVRPLPAHMHEDAPLVNCVVNDAVVDVTPHLLQTLFQFVCYLQRTFNKNQK